VATDLSVNGGEVVRRCRQVLIRANKKDPSVPLFDSLPFLSSVDNVLHIISGWKYQQRANNPWLKAFLPELFKLRDDFEAIVRQDPMIMYQPAHEVALAFHMSKAAIRYNRSANRTSKSQTGYAEHYYVTTGKHPYRKFLPAPAATFIVGVNFSQYAPNVFDRKFFKGEVGNSISPIFPIGGKWLNHYNDRKHIITIACRDCAEKGQAGSCKHNKSTITLYSDEGGPDVLQGAQFNLAHFDEHISEEIFTEAYERIKTVPHSSFIITGTPLLGRSSWEYRRLEVLWQKGPKHNCIPGTDTPFVSIHTIDQYTAGLVPKEKIDESRLTMDPLEQEARIYGRPAPLAKRSVFNRYVLHEMEQKAVPGTLGQLEKDKENLSFVPNRDGELTVWTKPQYKAQYIIGCDVAAGLTNRDYSCATVLKLPELTVVAQLHGWINPLAYAQQVADLGSWYNTALVVVERTGGMGVATLARLKELNYWNIFRDLSDPSASGDYNHLDPVLGVDTNIKTKSLMVSCLQQVIAQRQISIPCLATIEELRAFGQEITPTGLNTRFRGEGGSNDDRVMSLVIAVYVAISFSIFNHEKEHRLKRGTFWNEVDAAVAEDVRLETDPFMLGG
jgi:hypothetical protein